MSTVMCSLKNLKGIYEETKKYKCYSGLAEEQEIILKEIEDSLTEENQDDVCIEYYKYKDFTALKKPEDFISDIINKFGEDVIFSILQKEYNFK